MGQKDQCRKQLFLSEHLPLTGATNQGRSEKQNQKAGKKFWEGGQ